MSFLETAEMIISSELPESPFSSKWFGLEKLSLFAIWEQRGSLR
jgi:hypothetical protein